MQELAAFHLMSYLLAATAIIHSIEFLWMSRATSHAGVWRWDDIAPVLAGQSKILKFLFGCFLADRNFIFLNILRIVIAIYVIIYPNPADLILLLIIHVLTLLRWLGAVNGGSDYMYLLLLLFTSIGWFWPEAMAQVCLYYIAFQVCLSYFKAGWFKLKNPKWRNGFALKEFVNATIYQRKLWLANITNSKAISRVSSWLIICYELSFPLSLLHPNATLAYLLAGCCFHLMNAYVFGLNRFVLAWLASYPALYYCSVRLNG